MELRTVADVGLVGLPNAGKSTLLSRLSAAKPKIADYPFTTLTPNLGVAGGDGDRFVVADIPGLVEGAHEGQGLGHRFLRHIMRCRALVMVVDLSSADPPGDLATLREELSAYDRELGMRRSIVVGTKTDLVDDVGSGVLALGDGALARLGGDGRGAGGSAGPPRRDVEGGRGSGAGAHAVRRAAPRSSAFHRGPRGRRLAREGPQRRTVGAGHGPG